MGQEEVVLERRHSDVRSKLLSLSLFRSNVSLRKSCQVAAAKAFLAASSERGTRNQAGQLQESFQSLW